MPDDSKILGQPTRRVDGRLKVTGEAKYAGEYDADGLLHGYVVSASIAAGRILSIDTQAALDFPGVVAVYTHENRGKAAWRDEKWQDETAPPGHPFRPLHSDRILFDGQPIALVVAETYEAARDAATLVRASYERAPHQTDLAQARLQSYVPKKKRNNIPPPPDPRGDAESAFGNAPVRVAQEYRIRAEHHHPMELFASTCIWEGPDRLTIYDKTQGSQNSQSYVVDVFGLKAEDVRVINRYVGGAFGAALRPQHQLFFAVLASLQLERPVRVSMTRDQMFHIGYRPDNFQNVSLGADREGRLQAVMHDAVASTSVYEDYQEVVVNWSGLLYHCDNVKLGYQLAQVNTYTPCDMRAPGGAVGVTVLECAMDELAHAAGVDPLALRRRNFSSTDENLGKMYTAKALEACYREGAEAIGWTRRSPAPRSMREGRELVGIGMASGVWNADMQQWKARATLHSDGRLEVATAATDIGTGTWTILAQVGAEAFGLPIERVTSQIGDSLLPTAPVAGGSWTAASAGSAVLAACRAVQQALLEQAQQMERSPLAGASLQDVAFEDDRILLRGEPSRSVAIKELMQAAGVDRIERESSVAPDPEVQKRYISYTHSAVFAEVRVDEDLGVVRVTKIVCAAAAGRILNPKTARSQILGGVVMGLGMALEEEAMTDHRLGKIMNHNIAEYHMPVNADVYDIEVIFVDERDDKASPLGVKGLGEIGIVGTAAAIANAIFHATGKRIRDLPITIDKLLDAKQQA
jgi:xanthine dehydrogenase YagR molybdenum-binding subunit